MKTISKFALGSFCLLTLFALPASAATYAIDADHSSVTFKIRHLFSNVTGTFDKFEGTIDYEPDKPETWKAQATIQADSIDTRVEQRDKHLRSKDFFEVEKYPTLTFTSTKVTFNNARAVDATAQRAELEGNLTIHGVTKPVVLDLVIHGVGKDPWGNTRAGFTATTKIDRKDFGLIWNKAVETGGVLVGDEVEITLEVEGLSKG